jgi:hypothetical protein
VTAPAGQDGPITRDDIEAKFRELQSDVETTAESAKNVAIVVGAVVAVAVVLVVFALGKRRGHKKTTIVEVRRL